MHHGLDVVMSKTRIETWVGYIPNSLLLVLEADILSFGGHVALLAVRTGSVSMPCACLACRAKKHSEASVRIHPSEMKKMSLQDGVPRNANNNASFQQY
jgi:hypothetical protein